MSKAVTETAARETEVVLTPYTDSPALAATSYEFAEMEAALEHAHSLKTEKGRASAYERALQPIEGAAPIGQAVPVPEGCEIKQVTLDSGGTATVPVSLPAQDEDADA